MDPRLAREIVDCARDIFDKKTTNKLYGNVRKVRPEMITNDRIDLDNDRMTVEAFSAENDVNVTIDRKRELKKAVNRYETRAASKADNLRDKNIYFSTAYERGKSIEERWIRGESLAGNCAEQSDMAAFLAIKWDNTVRDLTYIAELDDPADHVFCVILRRRDPPSWRNVAEMIQGCVDSQAFVLDPWMNFSCYAASYNSMASAKMGKWLSEGKRINWGGKTQNAPGWYQPGGDYLECFLHARLDFKKAV
ncbi:hypothetical protein C8P66_11978 [Humitalea rosea]|uniref:Uncharacterized protein n=1 Tax=Humitalea rosea TaxID=990373 RepID=A0A2W7I5N1_9PROT|nr:hypothetical protein [Humitalea rosea]PZW42186.1 hypothetical protein C8P66_11978 [Humitalea rosea]